MEAGAAVSGRVRCRTASLQAVLTRDVQRRIGRYLPLPQLAAQLHHFSSMTVQPRCAGHHTQRCAGNEEYQEHQSQRRAPLPTQEVMEGYRIGVLDGEAEKDDENHQPYDPAQIAHGEAPVPGSTTVAAATAAHRAWRLRVRAAPCRP